MSQLSLPDAEPGAPPDGFERPAAERSRPALPDTASVAADAPSCDEYPSSDGRPMAENTWQLDAMLYAIGALQGYFSEREDVFASGDLLFYYEEGNSSASVAPDVFVVFGVHGQERMNYKVWEEGKGPDFVLEVASPGTWKEDQESKPAVYARMGVLDYFQYDPRGLYLQPELRGCRLVKGKYERLPEMRSGHRGLVVHSETLGLEVWAEGKQLRFRDPVTGQFLLSPAEERAARLAAEARIAELEALLRAQDR